MPTPTPIRLIIVEDEPLYRDLLRNALERANFEVLGAFGDARSALNEAPSLKPDVALLDIQLGPGITGVEVGIGLRRMLPSVGIVLLSNNTDPQIIGALPDDVSGGWSYLLKRTVSDVDALGRAINGAAQGLVMFDAALTRARGVRNDSPIKSLSARQREIVELIAQGYTNAAIARSLVLSEKSVENHLTRIYQQLGIAAGDRATHQRVRVALLYLESTEPLR